MTSRVEVPESTLPVEGAPSVSTGLERCPQGHEVPASVYVSPDALAGSLGHLWCQYCEIVITVPAYDVPHTRICECRGELQQVPGCRDCGAVRDHINDDCCPACTKKWAARERADELRNALIDIATSPWRKTA